MAKKQKKITYTKQAIFNICVVISLVLLGLSTYFILSYTTEQFNNNALSQFNQTQDNHYEHYKLQFCYEHNVKPCDDMALEAWNTSNPSDTFGFMTPAQLHGPSAAPLR